MLVVGLNVDVGSTFMSFILASVVATLNFPAHAPGIWNLAGTTTETWELVTIG